MMLGAFMLICVHAIYAIPFIHASWVAIILMIILASPSLSRPVRHVAFRGQNIPGQTTGYGIRPDIFHPEHRVMGYPGSHWQRTRKLLHHGPGSGKR